MKIIDADSHTVEPLDLFEKTLDLKYRDRAVRLRQDAVTGEIFLKIDGQELPSFGLLNSMAAFGEAQRGKRLEEMSTATPMNPDWQDMAKRVQFCDKEGIDAQVLYPTLALAWNGLMQDPLLVDAHCRAYNSWVFDLCAPYKTRLYPAAHISLAAPDLAVKELERIAKLGCRSACVLGFPPNGRSFGHPDFDPIWAVAQDHDIGVSIHIGIAIKFGGLEFYEGRDPGFYFVAINLANGPRMAITTMMVDGVFDRFPKLRVASIEAKSGWVGEWLERMDHFYFMKPKDAPMKRRASEYFTSNVWVCGDPDEKMFPAVVKYAGDDNFFVGSDYPHSEGYVAPIKTARRALSAELPAKSVDKILGANAAKFYGI